MTAPQVKPKAKRIRPGSGKGKGPKPNLARLAAIEKLIAAQHGSSYIAQTIAEKFNVNPRTVYFDINRVWERLEAEQSKDRPRLKARMRTTLQRIMQAAIEAGDRHAALRASRELSLLDGLYAETKVGIEHSGAVNTSGVLVVGGGEAAGDWLKRHKLEDAGG